MIVIIQNQPGYNFMSTLVNKFKIAGELFTVKKAIVYQTQKKHKKQADQPVAADQIETNKVQNDTPVNILLGGTPNESESREEFLKQYVHGLEEMMFMTHHKVRQPVANILGMATLISQYANSPDELMKIVNYMKQSALDLDAFTRELTTYVAALEQKGKNK